MGRFKRWISLFLCLTMVMSTMSVGAWASEIGPEAEPERYTVLVLDASASMAGAPAEVQKETALRFVDAALKADGQNEVAVVEMNATAEVTCEFTDEQETLEAALNELPAEGESDFTLALQTAEALLEAVEAEDAEKNIMLCSDGMVKAGEEVPKGAYTELDYKAGYTFANKAIETASAIKAEGVELYTLGFFQALTGNDLTFGQRFMKDLANAGAYCEVTDPAQVEFVFGDAEAETPDGEPFRKTGCFYYPSFGGQDYAATFFYDDEYFAKSAYEYQDSLATMTLGMALSAFGSSKSPNTEEGYKTKSQNLEYLLSECGFPEENYATNESFRSKPEMDSIGVGASHKTVMDEGKPYTLIAAAIRGGGYESEWASNFTLGEKGPHQGFSEARDQVLDFLSEYIEDQGITGDIKLWITGYSRAAATTNMVAGALDGGYSLGDAVQLDGEDLYAYCYECPQGAGRDDDVDAPVYQNIFNIVNPGDLVTKIAPTKPSRFGFQRFGDNRYLPTALKEGAAYDELQAAMLEQYHALPSTKDYVVDDFQMKKISIDRLFWDPSGFVEEGVIVDDTDEKWDMNAFLDETVYKLFNENVRTRRNYVNRYEADIRELSHALFGCGDRWDDFEDYFLDNLKDHAAEIGACLILHMNHRALRIVETALTDALSEAGITDYSARQIKQFALKVVGLIVPFAVANPNLTVTAVDNLAIIGSAHLPEVCMAWLQSFDPNYTPEGRAAFNSGIHRVVHVNSNADVYVYDSDGELVAAIVDGTSQELGSIVTYINEADEKLIYLPADEAYTVEVQAAEDGTASYSVQEYSEEAGGVNRIVNFYDLTLAAGETMTGFVPNLTGAQQMSALMDGSSTDYALEGPDGAQILADQSMNGEDAAAADCQVTATSNNEDYGVVTGSTVVKVGGYAKLNAVTNENCTFLGWYQDGVLVSQDEEYRFCVTEDVTVEGRFEKDPDAVETDVDFNWAEDYSSCTAVFTEGEETTEVECTVSVKTEEPTADEDGQIIYTAEAEYNGVTYTDVQTVAIPAEDEETDPEAVDPDSQNPVDPQPETPDTPDPEKPNVPDMPEKPAWVIWLEKWFGRFFPGKWWPEFHIPVLYNK